MSRGSPSPSMLSPRRLRLQLPNIPFKISGIFTRYSMLHRGFSSRSRSPFGSSNHSSYDDLPELEHLDEQVPTSHFPALEATEVATTAVDPSPLVPTISFQHNFVSAEKVDAADTHSPRALRSLPLTSESISFESTVDQASAWAQVAHHLANGKWPAPQVLPLVIWCLALFMLV